ncbi:alpha/beta hydrolase [Spirosoma harenae]
MKKSIEYVLLIVIGLNYSLLSSCHRPVHQYSAPSQSATDVVRLHDVVYGRKFGTALTMDVLKPAKPNGIAVVYAMSGGWHSDFSMIEKRLKHFHYFTDRGQTVFLILHGSAPRYRVDEVVQDIHRAVRFIRYHAADYGIDPNRLGISGMSSGGHLSVSIGTGVGRSDTLKTADPVDNVSSRVQAVACFFPPADLLNYGNKGRLFVECDTVRRFWPQFGVEGKSRDEKLAVMRKLSPINFITKETPPTLLFHGTVDPLVPLEQSERFIAKLKENGVPAQLIIHQDGAHGWDETWESDLGVVADWFEKYLQKR